MHIICADDALDHLIPFTPCDMIVLPLSAQLYYLENDCPLQLHCFSHISYNLDLDNDDQSEINCLKLPLVELGRIF